MTWDVSKLLKSIEIKFEQVLNILLVFLSFFVLKLVKSKYLILLQKANILAIVVTCSVLKFPKFIDVNDSQ